MNSIVERKTLTVTNSDNIPGFTVPGSFQIQISQTIADWYYISTVPNTQTHKKLLKMKQAIFLTLVVLAFSAMAQDEDPTTTAATTITAALKTCTEADNLVEYTTCQSLEAYCTTTVDACNGVDSCLDLVAGLYTAFELASSFSGVSTCACTEFTCEKTGVVYADGTSSTSGLVASLGLVGLMKLFL